VTAKKRNKPYRPKNVRIPVMKDMHDVIGMGMHTSYMMLRDAPSEEAFQQLAQIINMVGISIIGDERFVDEARIIESASLAMIQIGAKAGPIGALPYELLPVVNAVNCIDAMLPRLDGSKLHQANAQLYALGLNKA
jgi:hypothetical protein